MNIVTMIGWIGKVELSYSSGGGAYLRTVISTKEKGPKGQDGKYESIFEAHPLVVFGKQAEFVAKHIKKGQPVSVTGRLQTKVHEGKWSTNIVADFVEFLPKPKEGGSNDSSSHDPDQSTSGERQHPSNGPSPSRNAGYQGGGAGQDMPPLDDSELPF